MCSWKAVPVNYKQPSTKYIPYNHQMQPNNITMKPLAPVSKKAYNTNVSASIDQTNEQSIN